MKVLLPVPEVLPRPPVPEMAPVPVIPSRIRRRPLAELGATPRADVARILGDEEQARVAAFNSSI